MNQIISKVLTVPSAELHYDIHAGESDTEPFLLMIGSPMDAAGFNTLLEYFADRTVVTYDPRGAGRSKRTDGVVETNPNEHADDLHRLINEVASGPVDVFATSGGAVNGLVLVQNHPEQVRTLVAHEPPAVHELLDREQVMAATIDLRDTYERAGLGAGMAKFITLVSHQGMFSDDYADQPDPDPAKFGLPTADDGSRDDPLMANILSLSAYQHDFDALAAAPTRIVVAVGVESASEIAGRAGTAVAKRLGQEPVSFPSHHAGFSGDEYGMPGQPEAFATKLHEVLATG